MANIAFVGCAHIHTPGFVRLLKARPGFPSSNAQVKAIWDPNSERAKFTAQTLGQGEVVRSVSKIWNDPTIDGVVICSQTNEHAKLVKAAAKAGKHMFVEKPLGMSAKDSAAMAATVAQTGVKFQTGYFMRGNAIHRFLKQEIAAGRFGTITHVDASNCHAGALLDWFAAKPADVAQEWRWMADPNKAGCGAFGDLGTHMLDILMWLMGDVESVAANIRSIIHRYENCDETGQALLRFKSGATGTLTAGWVSVANPVTLKISGTKANAVIVNGQLYYSCKEVTGADGQSPFPVDAALALPHAFDLYIDSLNGIEVPLVPIREAAARVAVMEAMYTASSKGRWIKPNIRD